MGIILHIETSGKVCSVALSQGEQLLVEKHSGEPNSHAQQLTLLIQDICRSAKVSLTDLDAISVSKGPGSYTGLRIGVSTAKGLCYALEKPLISVNTLQAHASGMVVLLRHKTISSIADDPAQLLYAPMIDARRMEVYTAIFNSQLNTIQDITAEIISETSFQEYLKQQKILFFGDGASKCKDAFSGNNHALFYDDYHLHAKDMIPLALKHWKNKEFEDVAYFEPFYLKEFLFKTKDL